METKKFKFMEFWIVHIDDAFPTFYNEMLKDETLVYFNMMRGYTAKGYLNCMINEDKIDIDSFFNRLIN